MFQQRNNTQTRLPTYIDPSLIELGGYDYECSEYYQPPDVETPCSGPVNPLGYAPPEQHELARLQSTAPSCYNFSHGDLLELGYGILPQLWPTELDGIPHLPSAIASLSPFSDATNHAMYSAQPLDNRNWVASPSAPGSLCKSTTPIRGDSVQSHSTGFTSSDPPTPVFHPRPSPTIHSQWSKISSTQSGPNFPSYPHYYQDRSLDLAEPKQMLDSTMLTDTIQTQEPENISDVADSPEHNAWIMHHPQWSTSNALYTLAGGVPPTPVKHSRAQSKNTERRHKDSGFKTREALMVKVGEGGTIPVYEKPVPTKQDREKDRVRKQKRKAEKKKQPDAVLAAAKNTRAGMFGLLG